MMFYCSSGGSEPLSGSKTDIVRGIITEKLTTAAQEIFAVVERIVTDYEAEASGLRQQVDRQRRQLELLQPRVKLLREELVPDQRSHEVVAAGEEEEQPDEEEAESQDLPPWTSEVEDGGDDDEGGDDDAPANLGPFQDNLKDPDYIIPSRSDTSVGNSVRKGPCRPRLSGTHDGIDLRVRLLEDPDTKVLSNEVFKKTPVQDLKCPRGLQESDFLHLLRSSFPQLADGEPFDLFKSDCSRKLLPLRVNALTPEEILKAFNWSGRCRRLPLYIRLKNGKEKENGNEDELRGFPRVAHPMISANDQTDLHTRSDTSVGNSVRKGPCRPRLSGTHDGIDLRVRLLEDPDTKGLSNEVFKKTPVQDLKCPRGLQESDFLHLLRSSFPQLADGEPFDLFKSDCSRKLLPLRVNALTPEEILKAFNWSGRCRRLPLYIRLKNGKEKENGNEDELRGFPRVAHPMISANDQTDLHTSVSNVRRGHLSSSSASSQDQELKPEEEGAENDSSDGGENPDSDDWNPELESPTKQKWKNKSKTAVNKKNNCKVCGVWYRHLVSLVRHSWSHVEQQQDVCGVCEEKFDSVEKLKEHLQNHQKLHGCSLCGKTFVSLASLNKHRARHAVKRAFKCLICDQSFDNMSALYHHRLSHREEKPHQCDICQKSFVLEKQLTAHRETHSRVDEYFCKICNKSFTNRKGLTRHRAIHSAERRYACEVCGKLFKLRDSVQKHMRTHTVQDRSFLCHICSKTFPSNGNLKIHIQTHGSERPFICDVCGKAFVFKGSLSAHTRTHSSEAPHKCSECGRCFKWKSHLNVHLFGHAGVKRFSCGVCGKACYRQEHLKVHMRTHNGEKPYKCSICEKAFTQSHCLKTHMKIHQTAEIPVPGPPESSVTSSAEPSCFSVDEQRL
nr:zinc finger protein 227 [Nothobranchius furzeri]